MYISGWMMDYTNDTATPFIVFGICQIIGSAMVVNIPLVKHLLKKKFPPIQETINELNLTHTDESNDSTDCHILDST